MRPLLRSVYLFSPLSVDYRLAAADSQVNPAVADAEVAQLDLGEPVRQLRTQIEPLVGGVGFEPEESTHEMDDGSRRPGLGTLAPRYWTGNDPSSSSRPPNTSGRRP